MGPRSPSAGPAPNGTAASRRRCCRAPAVVSSITPLACLLAAPSSTLLDAPGGRALCCCSWLGCRMMRGWDGEPPTPTGCSSISCSVSLSRHRVAARPPTDKLTGQLGVSAARGGWSRTHASLAVPLPSHSCRHD